MTVCAFAKAQMQVLVTCTISFKIMVWEKRLRTYNVTTVLAKIKTNLLCDVWHGEL